MLNEHSYPQSAGVCEGSEGECPERLQALPTKQPWIIKDLLPVQLTESDRWTRNTVNWYLNWFLHLEVLLD